MSPLSGEYTKTFLPMFVSQQFIMLGGIRMSATDTEFTEC